VYKRFRELDPKIVPSVMTKDEPHTITIPMEKIIKMTELKENPFKVRICKVFSHDGTGNMTFNDFIDMLSVLSENASRDNKLYYAFKIYDFNEDQLINADDIEQVIQTLTRNELTQEEVAIVRDKVLEEADIDDDKCISFSEFRHVISRAPEFLNTFHMRI
ncbi:Calcium and integrin-binding family member 2, partial [Sarcoptes scabiei]